MPSTAETAAQPDAYVVVSWWQEKSSDGRTGEYEYETRPTLNDAPDTYREYEAGEYSRARPVGIFEVIGGMPTKRIEPARLAALMAETRAA